MCAPAGIRTPNLLIRSQMLYPIELRVRFQYQVQSNEVPRYIYVAGADNRSEGAEVLLSCMSFLETELVCKRWMI